MTPADERLTTLLLATRRTAVIGASPDPRRPSHGVATYLARAGYEVIPVNPSAAGQTLFGARVLPAVDRIETPVDIVCVFRRPDALAATVDEALATLRGLRAVWLQQGLRSDAARRASEAAGLLHVEDRCLMVEHARLLGGRMRRA